MGTKRSPTTVQQLDSLNDLGESAVVLPDGSVATILGPSTEEIASAYGSTRLFSISGNRRLRIEFVGTEEDHQWLDSTRLALFELRWDGPFPAPSSNSWMEPIMNKGPVTAPGTPEEDSTAAELPQTTPAQTPATDLLAVTTAAIREFRRKNTDWNATLILKAVAIVLKGFQRRWIAIRNWEVVEMSKSDSLESTPTSQKPESAVRSWQLMKDEHGNCFVRTWDAEAQISDLTLGKVLFDILTYLSSLPAPQATWLELQRLELVRSTRGTGPTQVKVTQLQKQRAFAKLVNLGIVASDSTRIRIVVAARKPSP